MVFIAFRLRRFAHHLSILAGMPSSVLYFFFFSYIYQESEKRARTLESHFSFFSILLRYEIMALCCWLLPPKVIHSRGTSRNVFHISLSLFVAVEKNFFALSAFSLFFNINSLFCISQSFTFFYDIKNFLVYFLHRVTLSFATRLRWRRRVFSAGALVVSSCLFVTAKFHR